MISSMSKVGCTSMVIVFILPMRNSDELTTGKTHPSLVLTNFKRQIFSLSAPKHPENDKINMTNPMDKMTTTGSSGIEVNSATSSKNPFSVQAHIPHVNKSNPSS